MRTKLTSWFRDSSNARIAGGGLVVLAFKVLGALGGYFLLYALASKSGPEAVGIYEVGFTAVLIGSVVGRWGFDTVIVRELGKVETVKPKGRKLYYILFTRVLLLSLFVGIVIYVSSESLTERFFGYRDEFNIFKLSAIIVPIFAMLQFNAEAFRGLHRHMWFSLLQYGTIYMVIAVLLWVLNTNPESFYNYPGFWAYMVMALFGLIALLLTVVSTVALHFRLHGESKAEKPARGLWPVATAMLVSSSLFMVMSWSDTLMLSYFMAEEVVGIYRIAFKIATLITFGQFAINTVVAPLISKIHNGERGLQSLTTKVATINLITAGPIFLGIVVLGSWLLTLFGLEDVSAAYSWLTVLAIGQVVNAFCGPVMYLLNMTGYEKQARNTMFVVAALNFVGNLVLIPLYGAMGAAMATTSTMVMWNGWAAYLVYKYHGVIAIPGLAHRTKKKAGHES